MHSIGQCLIYPACQCGEILVWSDWNVDLPSFNFTRCRRLHARIHFAHVCSDPWRSWLTIAQVGHCLTLQKEQVYRCIIYIYRTQGWMKRSAALGTRFPNSWFGLCGRWVEKTCGWSVSCNHNKDTKPSNNRSYDIQWIKCKDRNKHLSVGWGEWNAPTAPVQHSRFPFLSAEVRYPLEPLLPKMHGRKVLQCNLWAQLRPVSWQSLYVSWSTADENKNKYNLYIIIYYMYLICYIYTWYHI